MSVSLVQGRLSTYQCASAMEEEQALREITQEIALAALSRSDFFEKVAFQGGTSLRIFHGLNRFSEDMDFALDKPDASFALTSYLDRVHAELSAFGYAIEIEDRSKTGATVRQAFLKDDSLGKVLRLDYRPRNGPLRKLRIKLEVDTNPPAGATYGLPVIDFPFAAAVRVFDLPSLFAGKIHALLCRGYLKGRDWYDFIWYTSRRSPVNVDLLSNALHQVGPWSGMGLRVDVAWCVRELVAAIERLDVKQAREDVRRFLKPVEMPSLDLWTKDFFLNQCRKLV